MSAGVSIAMTAARSALASRQKEINIISNNVANANSTTYHRQSADVASNTMVEADSGYYGTGCHISQIVRHYDQALESGLSDAICDDGYRQMYFERISTVEDLIGPDATSMLNAAVQDFAASLQTMASSPESTAARTAFLGNAQNLTDTFNQQYDNLSKLRDNIAANDSSGSGYVSEELSELRNLIEQIPSLNDSISRMEQNAFLNQKANDLRDERDRVVKEISKYIDISFKEENNYKYTITLNTEGVPSSYTLVDGSITPSKSANYLTLSMTAPVDPSPHYTPQIVLHDANSGTDTNITLLSNSGEIRALLDSRDYIADKMDTLYTYAQEFGDSKGTDAWTASTAYTEGDYIIPNPPNGYAYRCTTAGTSDATQPAAWNTSVGGTTNDGTAIWTTEEFSTINAAHMQGYDLDGNRGGKIFDTNAAQPASGNILSVNTLIASSPRKVAVSSSATETGNGTNARDIWDTMNATKSASPFNGESILSFGNRYLADIAQEVKNAELYAYTSENIQKMFQNAVNERSGVSMDDEMTNMLATQRAYQAAAKLINVLDQMTQTVLSLG